jgi:hypothetical protein
MMICVLGMATLPHVHIRSRRFVEPNKEYDPTNSPGLTDGNHAQVAHPHHLPE